MYKSNDHQERMTPSFLIPPFIAYQWKWVFTKTFFQTWLMMFLATLWRSSYPPTYVHICKYVHTFVHWLMNAMHWIILSVLPPTGELAKSILLYCFRPVEMTCQMHDQTRVGHTQSLLLLLPRIDRFSMSFRSFRHIQHICTCVCTYVCAINISCSESY